MSEKKFDVIITGGGIAGLSAGALLSRKGYSCCVLEQLPIAGGRARVVEKDGFLIDYGIHVHRYAGQGRAADVLRKAGIARRFLPAGPPLVWHNGRFTAFPKGPAQIIASPLLGLAGKVQLIKLFAGVLLGKSDPADYRLTVTEWLKNKGATAQDLQDFARLISTAGLVCSDIERASAGELADFLRSAIKAHEASGYFLGGWDNLIEQFMRVIEEHGEVRMDVKAEKIIVQDGVAAGVRANGSDLFTRCVIAAVPVQHLAKIAQPDWFEQGVWDRMQAMEPTAGLSVDLCLKRRVTDISGIVFTMDPYTMGVFTSNIEPALAPRGKQLATWYYPIPRDKMDDKAFLKGERVRLNDLIESMFPGLRDAVEYERFIAMDMVDGAVPVVGQSWPERPAVDCSRVKNLFIAGDACGVPGQGGDIAFNAGIHAAEKAADFLK
jgi:phytoene dehydrogenase-like protein